MSARAGSEATGRAPPTTDIFSLGVALQTEAWSPGANPFEADSQ
jgi:hypothetical protein